MADEVIEPQQVDTVDQEQQQQPSPQQQDPPSKASKLYKSLLNEGYTVKNLGSEDEFTKNLSDPVKADKFYGSLRNEGYTEKNLGSRDEFLSSFAPVKKKDGTQDIAQNSQNAGTPSSPTQSQSQEGVNANIPAEDDIIGQAQYANQLANKTKTTTNTSMGDPMTVGSSQQETSPDENAIADSKKIAENLKIKGYDAKQLNNEFQDFPQEAFGMQNTSKEALLKLRKENPIQYSNVLNSTKTVYAIAKNSDNHTANQFNHLNDMQYGDLNSFISGKQTQQQIINNTLTGDEREKAQQRLEQNSSPFINAANADVVNEYKSSPLKDKIDPNQYAGLKTLQIFEPEKYEQAVKILQSKKPDEYELSQGLTFSNEGFSMGNVSEKETEESVNYKKGQETIKKNLAEIGRDNATNFANRNLYDLINADKNAKTPEEKNAIQQELIKNRGIINDVNLDRSKDDEKYPLSAQMKFDDQVKELTQNAGMNPLEYGIYRFGKGFEKSGNSINNVLTSMFGSEDDNTINQTTALGRSRTDASDSYLPSSLKSEQPNVIFQFPKGVNAERDRILNDKSLSENEQQQQLTSLVQNNKNKIQSITNPNAGKSANFFSKATLYGNAGMIGDLTSIAAQSAGLGVAGAGKLLSASVPMFTATQDDFYKQAVEEGNPNPDAYANTHALVMAAAGMINPDLNIVKRSLGVETALGKAIAGIDEATWNGIIKENKPLLQKFANSAKSVGSEASKMTAVYGAGTSIANDLVDKGLFDKNISGADMLDHAVKSSLDMARNSLVLFGVHAISNFKNVSADQKARIWENGTHPDIAVQQIDDEVKAGKLNAAKADQYKEVVKNTAKLIEQVPTENAKGKPLTDNQRTDYLYNLVVKNKAKELSKTLPESQSEKVEHSALVADHTNNLILEPKTDNQLETRKAQLEKILEPKKDDNGKPIELNEKVEKNTTAELEVVNDAIEKNKNKNIADTKLSQPIEGLDEQGIPKGDNVPPPTNNELIPSNNLLLDKTDTDIEKRMAELEDKHNGIPSSFKDKKDSNEYNILEKEMEKREKDTVFNVPLENVNDAINALMKKEKEKPNGFGSFIEHREAIETKRVANKYLNAKELTNTDIKKDFKDALFGNPATWYADGLKLRESMKEAANRGIEINDLLKEVEKDFTKDGFDEATAKKVIAGKLNSIFESSQKVNKNDISSQSKIDNNGNEKTNDAPNAEAKGEKVVSQEGDDKKLPSDFPLPHKSIDELNSKELFDYAHKIKDYNKNIEVRLFGEDGAKKYKEAQAVTKNSYSTHDEINKAESVISKMEDRLTPKQQDEFYGRNLPKEGVYDPMDLTKMANRIELIENADNVDEIANSIKVPIIDYDRAKDISDLSVIKAAKKKIEELGISPNELIGKVRDKLISRFKDQDNKEELADNILKVLKLPNEEIKTNEVPKQAESKGVVSEQVDKIEQSAEKSDEGKVPPEKPVEETGNEGNDVTSIKNEVTRIRREDLGLKEEDKTIKKSFGTTWDEAKEKIDKGFNTQDLINELKNKPRPVSDVEDALLLHHQNTKELELINTNKQINEAVDKDDKGLLEEAKVRRARILDELQDTYDVNKAVGRETARGLSARNMMVDRKYNLVNMLSEKRATNDGKPLSAEQEKEVEGLHQKIKETQEAFDDYVKKAEQEIKDLQNKVLGKQIVNKKSAAEKLRAAADRLEKSAKGQAYSSVIPITPKMIAGAMRLVADGLEKGGEILDLIKKAIDGIKKENPEIDEDKLSKEINKTAIESGIFGVTKETKQVKDFSDIVLDRKALKLRAENQRAKNAYEESLKKDEKTKESFFRRTQDKFIKWQRAFKLSNPVTMGKLAMAGLTRLSTTPLEDVVGGGLNKVLPKSLTKGAIGEGGGLNVKETAKAYKDGIIYGMKDAAQIMKKGGSGKSDLDTVFGKKGSVSSEALDFFGNLHSATKSPFKRAIFERSLSKRLRRSIANGVDVSDPLVQTDIAMGAYKDANRAIFMQDNKASDGWQKLVKHFDTVDPKTGKSPSKLTATALQWLVPFVKVPTNIAAEIGTHVYGVPVGVGKIIHGAFTKGLENLSADEKDVILRNLKKGFIGSAALTLGYMNPQVFGGFYQDKEKRNPNDPKAGSMKLFGMNVPVWLLESPIFQVMQIGATVRRVKDAKVKGEENGITEGMWSGALGLAEHVPMIDQPMRIFNAIRTPKERQYYLGELAKSTVTPALLQKMAEWTDSEDKRKPTTILQHIETGIPGLRQNVPASNSQSKIEDKAKNQLDKEESKKSQTPEEKSAAAKEKQQKAIEARKEKIEVEKKKRELKAESN